MFQAVTQMEERLQSFIESNENVDNFVLESDGVAR